MNEIIATISGVIVGILFIWAVYPIINIIETSDKSEGFLIGIKDWFKWTFYMSLVLITLIILMEV